jgi:hypothetical protein
MKKIILFMGLMFPLTTFASLEATVILVKGEAKTSSGKVLVLKDKIPAGETITTSARSFVKVLFQDNSQLNVGPESSVKIEQTKPGEPGLVNLVSGQIRSKVTKDLLKTDQVEDKFRVKTKTAAMGVRGTDFQVIYNNEGRNTSVVTYEGTVAVANPDGSNQVFVHQGQYSGVTPDIARPSVPVRVSPSQMESLRRNDSMATVSPSEQKSEAKSSSVPPGVDPRNFASEGGERAAAGLGLAMEERKSLDKNAPPPEGFYNASTGEYAPRAGGLIDLNTGVYVPPPPGAAFDPNTGVYVPPPAMGKFDPATGSYVPPKGVELDPKRGFVPEGTRGGSPDAGKETSNAKTQATLALLGQAMNPASAGQQVTFDAPMGSSMAGGLPPPPPGVKLSEPIADPTCPTCKEQFIFIPPPPPISQTTVNFNIQVQ